MSLLFISPERDPQESKAAVLKEDASIDIEVWPDVKNPERVQFAVVWNHPPHSLAQFPNLKAVSSLGAGVDHILDDETLPENLKICRVVDDNLTNQMKTYMAAAVLNYRLNMFAYFRQKPQRVWQPLEKQSKEAITIGVMGLGKIGMPVAKHLARQGYKVAGWSNSPKQVKKVDTFSGSGELDSFLNNVNFLICLLPLTPQTEGILDLSLFKKLNHPAFLVNVGRGEHLVDEDLIYALDKGWLEGAQLDVFSEEPLPEKHPFWNRENIVITPHIAAETKAALVAAQLVENYKRTLSGLPLKNEVNRKKHY